MIRTLTLRWLTPFYAIIFTLIVSLIINIRGCLRDDNCEFCQSCDISAVKKAISSFDKDSAFVICVVGEGVKGVNDPKESRTYSSDFSQGLDVYEAINYVMNNRRDTIVNGRKLKIVYFDDAGNVDCAKEISRLLSNSSKVVAIIGHSTTETTIVGLENYSRRKIPVLLPSATNPEIFKPYLSDKSNNFFRLPASDKIQVKAIAQFYRKKISKSHRNSIYLITDGTKGVKTYSEFLQNELKRTLGDTIKFIEAITYKPMSYSHIYQSVVFNKPGTLIFCGYGSLAREFLNGLDSEYKRNAQIKKPVIILSDGCNIKGIKDVVNDWDSIFISFPCKKPTDYPCLNGMIDSSHFSYEVYGYDAIKIIMEAANSIPKEKISRRTLGEKIANEFKSFEICSEIKILSSNHDEPQEKSCSYYILNPKADFISIDSLQL